MTEHHQGSFAALLRQLRLDAGLTQEELAHAATLSPRSVSDLERGINLVPRRETVRLLSGALNLSPQDRAEFEAVARRRAAKGDLRQSAWGATGSGAAEIRTLPRDIASFVGRESEVERLVDEVSSRMSSGAASIYAIGGMAGVGKTTFAVHAAHLLAPLFPDGQIYISLHGHTPGQRSAEPADALATLLLTTGISAAQIPPGPDARADLWRDRTAGSKMLLLLDDATGSEQVRPLLPGSAQALVLITSRRRLTALSQARPVTLEVMKPDEAAKLFIRLADRPRMGLVDADIADAMRLCGRLPLAISLIAGQLNNHPAWTSASLVADLASAKDRLRAIRAEDTSVAAAFDLSYRDLSVDQQRFLRLLSLHPGVDIDAFAAAALFGTGVEGARVLLDELYDVHLIEEPVHGRYQFHDLIRQYAHNLAGADEAAGREAARHRLLDYYVSTSLAAQRHQARIHHSAGVLPDIDIPPSRELRISTREQALDWMELERHNLLAVANYAAHSDRPRDVVILAMAMHAFLRTQGYWGWAFNLHRLAVETARRIGDRFAEACALNNLGHMLYLTGNCPEAIASQEQALSLYNALEDRLGQANVLRDLGAVQFLAGDSAAAASIGEALTLFRDLGDQLGQANTLRDLGVIKCRAGETHAAAGDIGQALSLFRGLGDRPGQAGALKDLGFVQQLTGNYAAAAVSLNEALSLYRDLGERNGEANALSYLGAVEQATADYPGAAASHEGALELYRTLGNRLGEANALNSIGELVAESDVAEAQHRHEQALQIARTIASPQEEARALEGIGGCYLRNDQIDKAGALLHDAIVIYQRIDKSRAERIAATLREVNLPGPDSADS